MWRNVLRLIVIAIASQAVVGVAHASPTLSLSLVAGEAGVPTTVQYGSRGVRPGQRVALQRRVGTGRVWRTVASLAHNRAGMVSIPALPLGSYSLRIAVLRGSRVTSQHGARLLVFGTVPLSRLVNQGEVGVYTLPDSTFRYVIKNYGASDGGPGTLLTSKKSPCRSVHFEFVPGTESGSENLHGETGSAAVVQESLDPVKTTVAGQTVGTVDATVIPGQSWSLNVESNGGNRLLTWYVNGSASCYSEELEG